MTWLEILKNDMLEITKTEAMEYWPPFQSCQAPYFNFRLEHVKHVECDARKLISLYGGDEDIVLASVWTHDRTKPQFDGPQHAKKASEWVLENLQSTGFPKEKIEDVAYAVRVHSGWTANGIEKLEAKILWDADKLAHFGPAYFLDLLIAFTSRKVCERENSDILQFHETISMENFLRRFDGIMNVGDFEGLSTMFYFAESVEMAKKRKLANKAFFEALKDQHNT